MTKEDELFTLANAPMSAPDRLKGLMDAATKHQRLVDFRRSLTEQLETTDVLFSVGMSIADEINETVEADCLTQEEVSAWASALLADGTLEDFRGFLASRDQLQQFVDCGNFEPQRPKAHSRLATLWSRLSSSLETGAAPSPTR